MPYSQRLSLRDENLIKRDGPGLRELLVQPRQGGNMPVLKNRNRLVTFRLSAEEFAALHAVCIAEGARSMSEFARQAILQRATVVQGKHTLLAEDLTTLGWKIRELDGVLSDLRGYLAGFLGAEQG